MTDTNEAAGFQVLLNQILELQQTIEAQAEMIQRLQAELDAIDNAVVVTDNESAAGEPAEPEYLEFETVQDLLEYVEQTDPLDWPRNQHTADTYALQQTLGTRKDRPTDFRPMKPAFVHENGEFYDRRGVNNSPFFVNVGDYAVVDCTFKRKAWICPRSRQARGNREQQIQNLKDYEGTIPTSVRGWPDWAKDAFLSTHKIDKTLRRIPPGMYAYGGAIGGS